MILCNHTRHTAAAAKWQRSRRGCGGGSSGGGGFFSTGLSPAQGPCLCKPQALPSCLGCTCATGSCGIRLFAGRQKIQGGKLGTVPCPSHPHTSDPARIFDLFNLHNSPAIPSDESNTSSNEGSPSAGPPAGRLCWCCSRPSGQQVTAEPHWPCLFVVPQCREPSRCPCPACAC